MDRLIMIRVCIFLTLLFALLLCFRAEADYSPFKLDEVTVDYRNYAALNPSNRPLLIYPESAKEGLNLDTNIDIFKYGYFDSVVESLTTDSQYRGIGLQINLGVRLAPFVDAGYWHHSQHVLDRPDGNGRYPVEDAVQVRFHIYNARPGRESLF